MARVSFGADIHEPDRPRQRCLPIKPYDIPLRALVPRKVDNLLVAGRCISGSFLAHASYRVTGNCVATGEGAGRAADASLFHRISVREYANTDRAGRDGV